MSNGYRRVVAVLQLAPPVNGLATINQAMVSALSARQAVAAVYNIAPGASPIAFIAKSLRMARTVSSLAGLIAQRLKGSSLCYVAPDKGPGLILTCLIVAVARVLRYDIWVHHHNYAYINRPSRLMRSLVRLLPDSAVHLFLCPTMAVDFGSRYSPPRREGAIVSRVLSNAAFLNTPAAPGMSTGPLVIGHLSNLTVEKGTRTFLELFVSLRRAGIDVHAKVAGPCVDPEMEEAIAQVRADHGDRLIWAGPVDGAAKAQFYASLDMFVFPTEYRNEAQPLVLLEALAAGCAIVATGCGCIAHDYASAPGVIATSGAFAGKAIDFVTNFSIQAGDRADTRAAATRFFEDRHGSAKLALDCILAEMTGGRHVVS